jgi:glycosyltransferase involved in cell wall biosynthesis
MNGKLFMELPTVNIVVPVYNQAQFVSRCLDSINNQDYPQDKIRIIIIDDGSSDESVNVASKYDITIIHQDHKGVGAARNAGVNATTSDIVAFLDSDDIASKSWLNISVNYLLSHEKDHCVATGCSHYLMNRKNAFTNIAWLEHLFRHAKLPDRVNHIGTSGSVFKKSAIVAINGFDTTLMAAEDMDLCSRIINSGSTLHLINLPLIGVEYPSNLFNYLKKQIKNVGYMTSFYMKPKSVRKTEGSYSGYIEYIQGLFPFVFVLSILSLNYWVLIIFITLLVLLVLCNISFLLFVWHNQNKLDINRSWTIVILPYFVLRSLAWSIGLIYGGFLLLSKIWQKQINRKSAFT